MNGTVFLVDDDKDVLRSLTAVLEAEDFEVKALDSAKDFLESCDPKKACCVVLDVRMPEMDGLQVQEELVKRGVKIPIIFLTGHGDIPMSVKAMKAGAFDFLQKPVAADTLIARVYSALSENQKILKSKIETDGARERLSRLSPREEEVLLVLLSGRTNKEAAKHLGLSPRTVEIHRKNIITKTGTKSLIEVGNLYHVADGFNE